MWAHGTYSHDGRFFSLPERNVLPKPYVKPHPPMWVAAGNPGTFEKAGKMGLGVLCFTGGAPEKMAPLVEIYKDAIKDAEPVGEFVNDNVAITTSFMCLEDRDAAVDWVTASRQRLPADARVQVPRHVPEAAVGARVADRDPRPDARAGDRRPARTAPRIVGNPEDCAEALRKWDAHRRRPADHGPVRARMYPHELMVEQTVELFGNSVIPEFDSDPEHSTSRYRALVRDYGPPDADRDGEASERSRRLAVRV